MNEQRPSKELAKRLRALDFGVRMPPSVIEETAEFLERLTDEPPAARAGLLLVPCPRCDGTGKLKPYKLQGDTDWRIAACPEKHVTSNPPPSITNPRVQFIADAAKRDDTDYRTNAQFYCRDLLLHIHGLIRESKTTSEPPSVNPNEGPIGPDGLVVIGDGVLPPFYNCWKCSQCGKDPEAIKANGPCSCGRGAPTKGEAL